MYAFTSSYNVHVHVLLLIYLLTGHPIVDVRTRALHSLMFKLSNQIIQPFELANDKPFLRSLLEWFNNDHWECEALVIQLLERLSCVSITELYDRKPLFW